MVLCKHGLKGLPYGGELGWLGGLALLGEMIFIPRSYGIFYVAGKRLFVQVVFTINSDVKPLCRTNILI